MFECSQVQANSSLLDESGKIDIHTGHFRQIYNNLGHPKESHNITIETIQ